MQSWLTQITLALATSAQVMGSHPAVQFGRQKPAYKNIKHEIVGQSFHPRDDNPDQCCSNGTISVEAIGANLQGSCSEVAVLMTKFVAGFRMPFTLIAPPLNLPAVVISRAVREVTVVVRTGRDVVGCSLCSII